MIPKAREIRLKPKVRKVLEARCRAPTTAQRDVKRARIVLLAAEGRSTRSIAAEVVVQPRIVSHWRRRFAEHGLGGLKDRPRAGKKPMYGKATNKRILVLLEKPPPAGYARWTGPLLAKVAQSGRDMVFDSAGPVTQRRLLHCRRAIAGAHRCFHRGIQRDRRAIRLDQEKGPPAAVQKSPYHSTLIPGTSITAVIFV